MLLLRLICFACIIFSASRANCQDERRLYHVINDRDTVGFVQATRKDLGSETQYYVVSDITLSMIFKVRVNYTVSAVFREGQLHQSVATIYVNDKVKHHVEAIKKPGKYEVTADGELHHLVGSIAASSATLYFQRPDDLDLVFSETSGVLKSLMRESEHVFGSVEPNERSNLNTYIYKNAKVLESVLVERFLMPTLYLVMAKNN